jgi:hypothetical protein
MGSNLKIRLVSQNPVFFGQTKYIISAAHQKCAGYFTPTSSFVENGNNIILHPAF